MHLPRNVKWRHFTILNKTLKHGRWKKESLRKEWYCGPVTACNTEQVKTSLFSEEPQKIKEFKKKRAKERDRLRKRNACMHFKICEKGRKFSQRSSINLHTTRRLSYDIDLLLWWCKRSQIRHKRKYIIGAAKEKFWGIL